MSANAQSCTFEAQPSATPKAQALALSTAKVNPCVTVPGLSVKSLKGVFALMLSTPKIGGKRFDTPPPAGLPEGKVMASAQGVEFKLHLLTAADVLGLQVKSGDALVFSVNNPAASSVFMPLSKLKAGESYEWSIATRQGNLKASFELLDKEELASVKSKLKALNSANLVPQVRLLYAAAIYDESELYLDRDQVLEELRHQVAE